ncbi:MAG: hypothetical protein EXS36_04325 [Pedosphaera sp.]|nr:hypothetical protein [Pedosphaera sp.]
MKTTLIHQLLAACTLSAALSSSSLLKAAPVTYLVDTNLTSVTLSGSVSVSGQTFDLKEQSPGSLTDFYGGR